MVLTLHFGTFSAPGGVFVTLMEFCADSGTQVHSDKDNFGTQLVHAEHESTICVPEFALTCRSRPRVHGRRSSLRPVDGSF